MTDDAEAPSRYAGVAQIVRYNWHFYALALAGGLLVAGAVARFDIPTLLLLPLCFAAAAALFWAVSSLAVSHYVYDRSELYRWNWLPPMLPREPSRWANIHAGLDQTSLALTRLFPAAHPVVLDIYLPAEMGEPSIERARRRAVPFPGTLSADPFALPLADAQCDAIFLIFAAHELRSPAAKARFFAELVRALEPGGTVVLVEHLRDWKNLLAYGPGALHFFSESIWLGAAGEAGMRLIRRTSITPFVRCLVFEKPAGGAPYA